MKYKLNYEIESTQERIAEVNKILKENDEEIVEHFDKYFNVSPKCVSEGANLEQTDKKTQLSDSDYMCKHLERMADYILYAEKRDGNIQTRSNKDTIVRREPSSIEDKIINERENEDYHIVEDTRTSKKPSITKEDLEKYPEINDIWKCKEFVKRAIKNKKRTGIMSDLGFAMNKLKLSLSGQFNFYTPPPGKPMYNFDNDTGYFDDNGDYILVSENTIDLNNPIHISELIDNYADLVDYSIEDCQSDIKHILYVLEELIDAAELPDYMFDILVWKIDGLTLQQISEKLQVKYGLAMIEKRVSLIYRDIIPEKICETYKNQYEDWLYTYKVRGAWKKCSACGEIKLATERNFGKHPNTKDGFQSVCKLCDNLRKNE